MVKRAVISLILGLLLIGGLAFWYFRPANEPSNAFRTSQIKHGDLVVTVSSTGTVVNRAVEGNLDLKLAEARILQARAARGEAVRKVADAINAKQRTIKEPI